MRKIVLFIGSLTGGGAERVTCNLANYLYRTGNEVEIITMSDVEDTYELDSGIKKNVLIQNRERKNKVVDAVVRYKRLGRYMMTEDVDCYVVMLPITIAMMLIQRYKTKAKIVVSERNDPASYSKGMQWLQKKLANRANGYVFQTDDARKWYGESIKGNLVAVIPNAINEAFIRESYSGSKRKVIVGAGRLKKQKNFSLLIRAFAIIAKQFPEYYLEIYGEGEKRNELEEQIKAEKMESHILLKGYTSNLGDSIRDAELFVLSSDYEGMPNALMEAMAIGIPCISTDCPCGGPRFLIQNGVNGILVPVGDAEKMAEAMSELLSDEEKRNNIGKEAAKVQERLAPEKIYKQWEEFIVKTCSS